MSIEQPREHLEQPAESAGTPHSGSSTPPTGQESVSTVKVAGKSAGAGAPPHPRDSIQPWAWRLMMVGNMLLTLIGGYDSSNAANVQVPIYKAFGHIELLPWIGLMTSMVSVASIPLARKLTTLFELRSVALFSDVLAIVGAALAGAAPNMASVIGGRVIMGVSSVIGYQVILSWNVIFSRPHELPLVQALVGAFYALGLISGPIVGGAFAENENATWRWAFYVVIPFAAVSVALLAFYPTFRVPSTKSTLTHIKEIDWLGSILWMGIFVTLGLGSIFSGSTWAWGSGQSIAVWTLFGVFLLCFCLQQYWCLLTVPERRAFPAHLLGNRAVGLTMLCVTCAGLGYGTTLYYTPIYFAFTRGQGALAAAVRLLPFIGAFIGMIFVSGGLLPVVRYYQLFFILGAVFILVGGGLLHTLDSQSPEGRAMGFEAIVGLGLGTVWQLMLPITSVVLPPHQRIDAVAMFNIAQMGGVSLSLMMSGAIYQNVGFDLVEAAVDGLGLTDHDIRELLSGVDSPIPAAHQPAVLGRIVDAVTETILRCYYVILAAGAVCLIGACCMKLEALQLGKKPAATRQSSEDREKAGSS